MTAVDEGVQRTASPLTAPSRVAALLRRHGLTPDRGLGQHFLVDASALRAIVEAAEVRPSDTVFEVGPGLGVLTRALAMRARRVVAVELDRRLEQALSETLAGLDNVELIHADATRFDFARLPASSLLVSNLPYNIATAVLTRALESGRFTRLLFLVQREVADRLGARPGTSDYGALSLFMRHFGEVRTLRHVPPSAFLPPPKVTSSVVRVDVFPNARPDPALFAFIRTGFAHRRKTLLKNLVIAGYQRQEAERVLRRLRLEPRVRAEELDLQCFRALSRLMQATADRS